MAIFPEMKQYVYTQKELHYSNSQLLRQPSFGWCARVCLDIAVAYALQKTIYNLNSVNPNLTHKAVFNTGKKSYKRNILTGGFADQIYNTPSQWKNGGLFEFGETDLNSCVISVMTKNNLWKKPDGKRRLAPVFTENKKGTITDKLSHMIEFLEEETPIKSGSYKSLRVCILQFVRLNGTSRHACIVCGTNLPERTENPTIIPTIHVFNPWKKSVGNINPIDLYNTENTEETLKRIFCFDEQKRKNYKVQHRLETVRLFSFKWWK